MEESSRSWFDWIRQGLRAAALRPVRMLPEGPGAWTMLFIVAAMAAIVSGASRLEIDGPVTFNLRFWLFGWAPDAILILGIWLVFSWASAKTAHGSPVAAWYLLVTVAMVPISLAGSTLAVLGTRGVMPQWWADGTWQGWAFYALFLLWAVIATWRISSALVHSKRVAASLVSFAFVMMLLSGWYLQTEEWQPDYEEIYSDDEFEPPALSQELFESQQSLLQESLQAIAPSSGGGRRVYGLIYAPYDQEVFLRESAMVQQVLEQQFGAGQRVVRLVNSPATHAEMPWATPLNLERSLNALAEAMDTGNDVLVVYLTSHGGEDFKLASNHWPLAVEDLTAERLRTMLDEAGIRHRVIAISACYSGGWIEPLQNDDTLIMTAADKVHTSYGCGSKSELTFFGRALFDEQLRKTRSFEEAFKAAVPVIKERELAEKKDDGFSNPQIFVGSNIRTILDELDGN
jgi:hypothetical protein